MVHKNVRLLGIVSALAVFSSVSARGHDPYSPQSLLLPGVMVSLTEVAQHYSVPNSELILLHPEAIRQDFPALESWSDATLGQILNLALAVVSEQQVNYLSGIRSTKVATSIPLYKSQLRLLPHSGRGGILTATLPENTPFIADLKGSGIVESPIRLLSAVARWGVLQSDQERDRFRLQSHSDGLMSLGEAIAEDFRQRAIQGLIDRILPGAASTVPSYAVIRLPLRILKDKGRSVPAAIYARRANFGRGILARSHPIRNFVQDHYGFGQKTLSGAMVDFGGVIIKHKEFKEWSNDIETGQPTLDPQRTWIWAKAHAIADLLAGTEEQRAQGRRELAGLENDLQSRLNRIGFSASSNFAFDSRIEPFPSEDLLSKVSDTAKILFFETWKAQSVSLTVSDATYLGWPLEVRAAYIRHLQAPLFVAQRFLEWVENEPDPALKTLALRKLYWGSLDYLSFNRRVLSPSELRAFFAASRLVDLKIAMPVFQQRDPEFLPRLLTALEQADSSFLLMALSPDTEFQFEEQDLWKLFLANHDLLVRLALLSKPPLLETLAENEQLQRQAVQTLAALVSEADLYPDHLDWRLFQENLSGAVPAVVWIGPILDTLPSRLWVEHPQLAPRTWVKRFLQWMKGGRPVQESAIVIQALTQVKAIQPSLLQAIKASELITRLENTGQEAPLVLVNNAASELADAHAHFETLLKRLENYRSSPVAQATLLTSGLVRRHFLVQYERDLRQLASFAEFLFKHDQDVLRHTDLELLQLRLARLALAGPEFETGQGAQILQRTKDACALALRGTPAARRR